MTTVAYLVVVLVLLATAFTVWAVPKFRAMAAHAKVRTAEDDAFIDRYLQRRQEIAALSFEEARQQAEVLLADPRRFGCVPAPPDSEEKSTVLAPGLQSLFRRFDSIATVEDEAVLSRESVAPFGWEWEDGPWRKHQFWQIGRAHGHAVTLVKPHQEGIYDIEDYDEQDNMDEPDFPSVYHWLLMVGSEIPAEEGNGVTH